MKQPEVDLNYSSFDRNKRFYRNDIRGFTFYNTGEAQYTHPRPDPDYRQRYDALNIHVFGTDKVPFNLETPEGQRVVKAWLCQGTYGYFLADLDHGMVVSVHRRMNSIETKQLPIEFSDAVVYWPNKKATPIAAPFTMSEAYRYTPEMKEYLREASISAKILGSSPTNIEQGYYNIQTLEYAIKDNITPQSWVAQLNNRNVLNVAQQLIYPRKITEQTHLRIK